MNRLRLNVGAAFQFWTEFSFLPQLFGSLGNMSCEYVIKIDSGKQPDLKEVSQALRMSGLYELISVTDAKLKGAFLGTPLNTDWPEDFTVLLHGSTKLISIHGGTMRQRQQLLADLQTWIQRQGIACDLEEL